MRLPERIKVFDVDYPIKYFDTPAEVSLSGKEELAFQWDIHDGIVRIHQGERSWKAICQSIWSLVIEIICKHMIIEFGQREETIIERLAVGLNTFMLLFGDEKEQGAKLVDENKVKK